MSAVAGARGRRWLTAGRRQQRWSEYARLLDLMAATETAVLPTCLFPWLPRDKRALGISIVG